MKGFASTLIFILIISLLVFQLNLNTKLYSSMLEQKENIILMQRSNEKIYSMVDGFKKTAEDANEDVAKKTLNLAGKIITLEIGKNTKYLDEVYICYKLHHWAYENNYSLYVSLINPFDLSEEKPSKKLLLKNKEFDSINSNLKKLSQKKLFLSPDSLCPVFIYSEKTVKVELNKDLPLNPSESIKLLTKPFAFVLKSNLAGEEVKAVIPQGNEL